MTKANRASAHGILLKSTMANRSTENIVLANGNLLSKTQTAWLKNGHETHHSTHYISTQASTLVAQQQV
jgi:hypothetical protein